MVDFAKLAKEHRERRNTENRPTNTQVSISIAGSDYAIKFGYDKALLKKLKDAVPESDRTWHKARKVWLVSPEAIGQAVKAIEAHAGKTPVIPALTTDAPQVLEKTFLLEYLGTTRDRGNRKSAYGSVNGEWSAEFSEDILRGFFDGGEANQKPDGLQTLYQVLCVFERAIPEDIKKAYKRLARQWHPDVCRESEAAEMFRKINEAYKALIDPELKRRYDAGLYFARQAAKGQQIEPVSPFGKLSKHLNATYYRAPLRCGQITAKGTVRLMRFVVSEIIKWDDVINPDGKVMLATWPAGADKFQILWV